MASLFLVSLTACGGGGTMDCKDVTCDGDKDSNKGTDNGSDDDDSGDGSGGDGDNGDGSGGDGENGSGSGGDNGDGSGGDGENGGEETTKVPPASGTEYVTLDQTNDLESKLSGVAILINPSTQTSQSVDLTGAF